MNTERDRIFQQALTRAAELDIAASYIRDAAEALPGATADDLVIEAGQRQRQWQERMGVGQARTDDDTLANKGWGYCNSGTDCERAVDEIHAAGGSGKDAWAAGHRLAVGAGSTAKFGEFLTRVATRIEERYYTPKRGVVNTTREVA